MSSRSIGRLTLALACISGCAAPAISPMAPATPTLSAEATTAGGPTINWDMPIPTGLVVSADQAQLLGKLPFAPITPEFTQAPTRVVVSDPILESEELRAVAFVYDFPPGTGIAVDGRMHVLEGVTDASDDLFRDIVESHTGLEDEQNYDLVTIGGRDALLIHTETIGRVRFVRDGIYYDLTGPALSPGTALALAEDLARTVDSA